MTASDEFVGDYGTPEQEIPATGLPGVDWETCMTMNNTWGFKSTDTNWKSTKTLIRNLVDTTSKGGNYLLNVGPTAEGEIPTASVERLKEMGEWLAVNGDSVYQAKAGPFAKGLKWGVCTVDGDIPTRLYFHIFDWPESGTTLRIPGLMNDVSNAWFLKREPGARLRVLSDRLGKQIRIGRKPLDEFNTVLVVDVVGEFNIVELPLQQHPKSRMVELLAEDAEIHGTTARYEGGAGKDNIGYWSDAQEFVTWRFHVHKPGQFKVEVEYACPASEVGSVFALSVFPAGEEADGVGEREPNWSIAKEVGDTGSWTDFVKVELGPQRIAEAGVYELRVQPMSIAGDGLMNLKAVRLVWVEE